MENTNKNESAPVQAGNNQGTSANGEGRHRRHRGHRGGKHHGGKKENVNGAPQSQVQKAEKAEKDNKPNAAQADTGNQGQPNQKKHSRSRNRNRHRNKNGQENRQQVEKGLEEDFSLADLRARIVLKAADGSVPSESVTKKTDLSDSLEDAVPVFESTQLGEDVLTPAPDIPEPPQNTEDRIEVVGVRFRTSGKMYYFDPAGIKASKDQQVIVETTRGPEFGIVCLQNTFVSKKNTVLPLRPLLRIATEADVEHNAENCKKEQEALALCREKIDHHKLDMKLIDAQYAFDNSKLLFYFASEGRVDFRDLVKDLAALFHTRIELRQIGIRDEARMLGGLGACGRMLCCSTFLPDFTQVSIKMAKEQNLSLNSSKISGVCGRLMCCLHYEAATYSEEIRKTPANDSIVKTEDGVGVVIGSTPLTGMLRVVLKDSNDQSPRQYHRDSVTVIGKEKRGQKNEKAE